MDLSEGFQSGDATAVLDRALDYGVMYLEGGSANLLAKEFVAMEYEHRVFVVEQCAVTAAGCVEDRG